MNIAGFGKFLNLFLGSILLSSNIETLGYCESAPTKCFWNELSRAIVVRNNREKENVSASISKML